MTRPAEEAWFDADGVAQGYAHRPFSGRTGMVCSITIGSGGHGWRKRLWRRGGRVSGPPVVSTFPHGAMRN